MSLPIHEPIYSKGTKIVIIKSWEMQSIYGSMAKRPVRIVEITRPGSLPERKLQYLGDVIDDPQSNQIVSYLWCTVHDDERERLGVSL